MWTEQFHSMLILMVMASLLRASYELSKPNARPSEGVTVFAETYPAKESQRLGYVTPQQKEWAEKAVKRYAEAQKQKWRNWNEAMFEPAKK